MRSIFALPLLAVLLVACAVEPSPSPSSEDPASPAPRAGAAPLTEVPSFGSNPGALKMFRYVPPGLPAGAPLVVAMHGCTQSASVYSTLTEWNVLADRYRFAVVFPEQPRSNNSSFCFNWFQLGDISRGQGEALSIKQMVDVMTSDVGSDPARVFATGLSAGGFMTEVLLATYPDVFRGGAVNAGGPYACATSLINTSACQQGNVNRSAQQWGQLVRDAFPGYGGPYPRLIAFHGASDTTVAPADLEQSVAQWSNVLGIDAVADVSETFRTATRKVYRDGAGVAMIETYLIAGSGHALSVDPGAATDQGGSTGAFSEDHDLYSSYYAARFWGLLDDAPGGDRTAPTVTLTAPAAGSTVSGTVTLAASASDDVGVTRVDFLVDGAVVGGATAAPYALALDSRTLSNGAHVLGARALDAAGNVGVAPTRTVTVQNGGGGGGGARLETFSAAGGTDQPGWTLGGFTLVTSKDATGVLGSRSLTATAAPRFGTVTRTATWSGLALGAGATLSYQRQLSFSNANLQARARLQVFVNDGADHLIDEQVHSALGSYVEATWTRRAALDLSAFAGKVVTLKLVVTATDLSSTVTRATAWLDQLELR